MNRYVCIHGHFYQPPRENPWLEEIELQDSAYPYHDWNEKITAECYAPNTASRILDTKKRIVDIVNDYAKISFDFGPTLLSWMERKSPAVYEAIIQADRFSRERFSGHGSAMAQVYNHVIMPLASPKDKRTQVIWGIRDFEHRFGRKPEGMWLAECAVDVESLEIMAKNGILFTILAPHQAKRVRGLKEAKWVDVSGGAVDPKMPYQCRLPSGSAIAIFFYDGPASRDVAFGELLKSGEHFASRLIGLFSKKEPPQIAHIATDGETYGHHRRFGEMALSYTLSTIESNHLATITNYGEYLAMNPPSHEVEIFENTSWSCAHGIERWRSDCGCNTGAHPGWTQKWRAPLREAMKWLGDSLAEIYEREMGSHTDDPWQARDDYISVILDRSDRSVDFFLSGHTSRQVSRETRTKLLKLLEMQRHAMLMFTSCAWFFDEISGIESLQAMQYALRAMQLAREVSGEELEPRYLEILKQAPSNLPAIQNGVQIWENFVRPATIDLIRAGAHYAISSLFEEYQDPIVIYHYTVIREIYDLEEAGIERLAVGRATIRCDITDEEAQIEFALLHLGDHNFIGGVRRCSNDGSFAGMSQQMKKAFGKSDITEIIRLMDAYFEAHNYSLWHLFKDEQRKVLGKILEPTLSQTESTFRQIYERHLPAMQAMTEMRIPLPRPFAIVAEFIAATDISSEIQSDKLDFEKIGRLVEEVRRFSLDLDKKTLGFVASQRINSLMREFAAQPDEVAFLEDIARIFTILADLNLEIDLWAAQNVLFSIGRQRYDAMEERAAHGEEFARKWLDSFNRVAESLSVENGSL